MRLIGLLRLTDRVRRDRRGAAVAEYGLIAAVAGVAIAVASLALGSAVSDELAAAPAPVCATDRC